MAVSEEDKGILDNLSPVLVTACDPEGDGHLIFKEILNTMEDAEILHALRYRGVEVTHGELDLMRRYYTGLYG